VIQRIVLLIAALAATAAAAVVIVAAAALAVFALARPWIGEAGAAAAVVGVFGLLIALIAVGLASAAKGGRPRTRAAEPSTLMARIAEMAKARPWAAAGVAMAAAAAAASNPAVVGAIARAFVDGANRSKSSKR
jgi:hypothetical protein